MILKCWNDRLAPQRDKVFHEIFTLIGKTEKEIISFIGGRWSKTHVNAQIGSLEVILFAIKDGSIFDEGHWANALVKGVEPVCKGMDGIRPGYVGPAADLIKFLEVVIESEEALIDPEHQDEASQVRLETLNEVLNEANRLLQDSVGRLR